MSEPQTEAGRRLLALDDFETACLDGEAMSAIILAIESEAQRLTVERLREARAAISRAHGSLHLGDTDGVDRALEEARAALTREEAEA
jgi:hypothetical protein